uniref:Uncharacterized protein n=1 Tax=Nelumbo nucifera TaxID=4432 RepID=A0A822Z5U9_NELNU|nr:TPA_asm: hypothetical protein HUJ06_013374 [Nelumbo nucifera]
MFPSISSQKSHLGMDEKGLLISITEQDLIMGMDEKGAICNGGAVKKLKSVRGQSSKTLKAEIKTLAKIRHKNITKLLGFFLL